MSTPSSPHRRWYRDSSPKSPLTPLSPSALPRWLRQNRSRTGVLSNARLRFLATALGCMLMGWVLTSMLSTGDGDALETDVVYDPGSVGILEDPSGFGTSHHGARPTPGIVLNGALREGGETAGEVGSHKESMVTDALAGLHDAVKGKIQSWNPYRPARPVDAVNATQQAASHDRHAPSVTTAGILAGESIREGISEEDRLGARIRIGKCTILFNGNSFWERAIRTHERHDREHGYRLHVLRQPLMDDVWSKPAYILSLLLRELAKPESERLEWLFWVDADTIILNPYIPIDVFLPPPGSEFDDIHLMYSNDWNGLNNGVFPVRVNQWSVHLFSAITSFRHFRPDVGLQFRDQSAMDMLMKELAFANNLVETPQRWFNAYQGEHNETLAPFQIRRGDFLVHFAGVPNRDERMAYWLDRAEQHLDDWEIPVKSTSYLQEVRDFWSEQRSRRQEKKEALASARLRAKELLAKVDQDLTVYGDRLTDDQTSAIQVQRDALNAAVQLDDAGSDTPKMDAAAQQLEDIAQSLRAVVTEAQKLLLESAHEAIFAGEKDLLEHGFGKSAGGMELESVSNSVKNLKNLVMTPQEHWNRHDITAATNAVTQARVRLQDKAAPQRVAPQHIPVKVAVELMNEGGLNGVPSVVSSSGEQLAAVETATAPSVTVLGARTEVRVTAEQTSHQQLESSGVSAFDAEFEAAS